MAESLFKTEDSVSLNLDLLSKAVIRLMKQSIFEKFMQTGTLSEEDQEFCDEIKWHPIDELELKEEYVDKLREISEGPHSPMTIEELDKLMNLR